MKIRLLLVTALVLCVGSGAWAATYDTGSCTTTAKTQSSLVRGHSTEDGWFKFDVTAIPDGDTISSVTFNGYVYATYYPYWSMTPVTNDPVSAAASTLNADIVAEQSSGYYLYRNETSSYTTGWKTHLLGGAVNANLQAALVQDWFAIGHASRDNSTTYYIDFEGWAETNVPYLTVECSSGTYTCYPGSPAVPCAAAETDLGSVPCPGELVATSDTTGLADYCGNTGGDLFYRFTAPAYGTYTISTCYPGTYFDTYLHLYSDICCGTEIAFNDDDPSCTWGGLYSTMTLTLAQGSYVVHVEGHDGNEGAFELHIACDPYTCEDVEVDLGTISCPTDVSYIGTTVGAFNFCGNAAGDAFFAFTVPEEGDYTISLCYPTTTFDTYLRLYSDACCGTQIDYDDDGCDTPALASLIETHLTPGVYHVQVEGYSSNSGPYELHVICSVCEGKDTCEDAYHVGPGGTFTGDTSACGNDYSTYSDCITWPMAGPDQVYDIPIECSDYEICVTVTPTTLWDPGIAMAFECTDGTIQCLAGADAGYEGDTETVCFQTTGGQTGTLYIFVDSYNSSGSAAKGPYTLDVTLTTLTQNDTCATAADISAGGTFTGDTCCGVNDYSGAGCGFGWNTPGPDLVYTFTIPDATHVDLQLLPLTMWDSAIYLVGDCGDIVGSCVAGADEGLEGDPETLSLDFPCGGTYYLIVDSYYPTCNSSCGPFQLLANIASNPPADTFDVDIQCPSGPLTLPGQANIKVILESTSAFYRMICGQVDVTLCNGQVIQNIRSGSTVLSPGELTYLGWGQKIPANPRTCNCDLVFTVTAEDCTPCEENNMIPGGWTETDSCVVHTICP